MKRMFVAATILTMALTGLSQAAGDDGRAAVLLQAAQVKETIQGDLKGAIALYRQAAEEGKTNRPVAAKALLALGLAYQKSGSSDARAVFERIVREYGEQKEAAAAARMRLTAMGGAANTRSQFDGSPRRVLVGNYVSAISPDGTLIALSADRDLIVRKLATDQVMWRIPPSTTGSAGRAMFSPDGRQLAYTWSERANDTSTQSLRVIGADGQSKTLVTGAPFVTAGSNSADVREIVSPAGWSPDGTRILAEFHPFKFLSFTPSMHLPGSQLAWVSVNDGTVRVVKSFEAPRLIEAATPRLSPDGRFLAYADNYTAQAPIKILDLQSGEETDVVKIAGANRNPRWTPDGSRLLFTSDRSGTASLWTVSIQNGSAAAEPSVVRSPFSGNLLGVSTTGDLYYSPASGGDYTEVIADRASGRTVQSFLGMSGTWSPDGKWIAFMRPANSGDFDLLTRSVETGAEHLYRHTGVGPASPRWFHDSSAFLVRVNNDGNSGGSYCIVGAGTGEFKSCFARNATNHVRSPWGALAPDDRTLYVAARKSDNGPWAGIVGVNLVTGEDRPIATFPTPLDVGGLAISPDGSMLAMEAGTAQAARILTIATDGTGLREVYGPFVVGSVPNLVDKMRWTPDGQSILFLAKQNAGYAVMRISGTGGQPVADGFDTTKSVDALSNSMAPSNIDPSPDGSKILVGGSTRAVFELWAIDNFMSLLSAKH